MPPGVWGIGNCCRVKQHQEELRSNSCERKMQILRFL